jgi:hypothetical protein
MKNPSVVVAWLITCAACGSSSRSAPAPTYRPLEGEVARAGEVRIDAALVARAARARGVAPRQALDGLIDDALAAQGARASGLDRAPAVVWATSAALARAVPTRIRDEARAAGPPSGEEMELVTVVHAVVQRGRGADPAAARSAARAIAEEVATARSDDEFMARAKAAVGPRVVVRAERLPPFDAAGRTEAGDEFDPDFVAAAFALRAAGDTSPVVETPFGWHVLRLVARAAPAQSPADREARRSVLTEAVLDLRARIRLASLLRARALHTPVETSIAADELMASIAPGP